ncbi:MAG TPA: hypothetical protein VFI11_06545 [Anaerolineales bacterium]|nr:hypothetical protein [Anaerolineales bacterium]
MPRRLAPLEGIHDVVLLRLWRDSAGEGVERFVALQFEDHLLRRFGQTDVWHLAEGSRIDRPPQAMADEVWVLVEGKAAVEMEDRRESSPSAGAIARLAAAEPLAWLVPFGIAMRLHAESPAVLIRMATHSDGPGPDQPPRPGPPA